MPLFCFILRRLPMVFLPDLPRGYGRPTQHPPLMADLTHSPTMLATIPQIRQPLDRHCLSLVVLVFVLLGAVSHAQADDTPLRIAVAANFAPAMRALVADFRAREGGRLDVIIGSTGKLYAQIHHGAPFDALFAADERRPALLEAAGRVRAGSRFTYAMGRLALWSPQADRVDAAGQVLRDGPFRHLAIANPKLAPYGRAAQQVLQALGLWQTLRARTVRGENVGQALQFVRSGNAELGLVALSQVQPPGQPAPGSLWVVPPELYTPIVQQAVLLTDNPRAADFLRFVQTDEGRAIIQSFGYQLP